MTVRLSWAILFLFVVNVFLSGGVFAQDTAPTAADAEPAPFLSAEEQYKKFEGSLNVELKQAYDSGEYAKAIAIQEKKLRAAKQLLPADHAEIGELLNELALNYKIMGRYVEAEPLYLKSLEMVKKSHGDKHEYVAVLLNNIAKLYVEQRRFEEAEVKYKEAIKLFQSQVPPADKEKIGQALGNLGDFYKLQERYLEAESFLNNALKLITEAKGPNSANAARTLHRLAELYRVQGRFEDAEPRYLEAIKIYKVSLDPKHPNVAVSLNGLGLIHQDQKRYGEAEKCYLEALAIFEGSVGGRHLLVGKLLNDIVVLYTLMGRTEDAAKYERRIGEMPVGGTRDASVYFVTSRKRTDNNKILAFGGERASDLSHGVARVTLPAHELIRHAKRRGVGLGQLDNAPGKLTSAEQLEIRTTELFSTAKAFTGVANDDLKRSGSFKNQVLIFVHGYNVSFEDAVRRAGQIAFDLEFDGVLIAFSWPSSQKWFGYGYDRESADIAVNHLVGLIDTIASELPGTTVHLVAHSMGNQVALEALEKFAIAQRSNTAPTSIFGEAVLAHPDVDSDRFIQLAGAIKPLNVGLTLYTNSDDWALWFSRLLRGTGRAGGEALIIPGVDTIDTSGMETRLSLQSIWNREWGWHHDVFVRSPVLFGEISRLLLWRKRPPHERTVEFKQVAAANGVYWCFKPKPKVKHASP